MLSSSSGKTAGSRPGASTSRGSLLASGTSVKPKKQATEEPALKPRKVKNANSKYRDRATERRTGGGNDFADAEALLKNFEERAAENDDKAVVEEQRKYLGGDAMHSVLVKGLDFALLDQTKARVSAANEVEDEDELERAFHEAKDTASTGQQAADSQAGKKSRADLLKGLKAARDAPGSATATTGEKALDLKGTGKFKPIGFKPIGGADAAAPAKKKKKKAKDGTEGERTKKKRKIEADEAAPPETSTPAAQTATASEPVPQSNVPVAPPPASSKPSTPPPEDEDFDIFAGVGDYEGVDLGDSSDEEGETRSGRVQDEAAPAQMPGKRGWFDDPEPEEPIAEAEPPKPVAQSSSAQVPDEAMEEDREEEEEKPMRLQGLSSTASIKDMLAIDEALAKEEKRRARKEKKKKAAA